MSYIFNPFTGDFDNKGCGTGGDSLWQAISDTVTASSTQAVDSIVLTSFTGVKYFVTIEDSTNNKTTVLEMNVKNQNGSIRDNVFGKISGGISFQINAVTNAGNMELEIVNNEVVDLDVEIKKLVS